MKVMLSIILVTSFALLSPDVFAGKQDEGLHVCQFYKDEIEKYEDLRRGGGSASEMDQWKKKKREYEEKFRNGNCSRHRGDLN